MWEKKPVLLLLLATGVILIGTIVTMVLPFAWVNTEHDKIETVTPYTALEQEGRDVYIREGCNNCHSQTVRPLVAEVLRYGEYSKSGEFVYDRPFLWGSKRTGPDLARLGGKYPDDWHYKHMDSPRSMVPKTNMPDYKWLRDNQLDPEMIQRKMEALNFPYTDAEIKALTGKNEMDAIVAYMQKLGTGIPWREATATAIVGDLENPFKGDAAAIAAGKVVYNDNCAACHAEDLTGDIGPELTDLSAYDDAILYEIIYNGIPDGGMPGFASLGSKKVWQMVNYLMYKE
jgi:cytochrome c oxidase cbb3-type subunit 2